MSSLPVQRVIAALHSHGCDPKPQGKGHNAKCPCHDDRKASLSINQGDDGRALLHCHAGCDNSDIVAKIDLTLADLMPPRQPHAQAKKKIVANYQYRDANSEVVYEVVRYKPKGFGQRRPDGSGDYIYSMKGVQRILYHLPELLAAGEGSFIFVVEGEKDVDRLGNEGVIGTTCPQGAGKWAKVDDTPLHGRHVIIIADNDAAGRKHAIQVAAALHGKAKSVRVLYLPDLPDKGDVSDWFDAGGDAESLVALAEQTAEWMPGDDAVADDEIAGDDGEPTEIKKKQADLLVELAADVQLFHTPNDETYAVIEVDDHDETWQIRSKGFRQWLSREFFLVHGKAPSSQALQEALDVICGKAMFDSPAESVAIRVTWHGDAIWLDLCNADWQVVEITADGWRVVEGKDVPVRFVRRRGMGSLPVPVSGGQIDELRPLVNVPDDDQWYLVVAWLIMTFNPCGPYPILSVNGEQGSAKSSLCRMLRELIDPNEAPLRRPPRSEHDLMIAASNGWCIGFDNLSGLKPDLSDGLCTLATGGGFAARQLYSDNEEQLFNATRPIMVNGIDDLATRPDLLDRSLNITLPTITDDSRRDEKELKAAFDNARPRILGALLDAVSTALKNRDSIKLSSKPRMADFAVWATAAEQALDWKPGAFLAAYNANRQSADSMAIEASPVGIAIIGLMEGRQHWQGRAGELLDELNRHHSDEQTRQRKDWPKSATAMGNALRRIAPNLRKAGINHIPPSQTDKTRTHVLEQSGQMVPSPPEPPINPDDDGEKADSLLDGLGGLDSTQGEPPTDRPS